MEAGRCDPSVTLSTFSISPFGAVEASVRGVRDEGVMLRAGDFPRLCMDCSSRSVRQMCY
jgi:hypothetical protein